KKKLPSPFYNLWPFSGVSVRIDFSADFQVLGWRMMKGCEVLGGSQSDVVSIEKGVPDSVILASWREVVSVCGGIATVIRRGGVSDIASKEFQPRNSKCGPNSSSPLCFSNA
ncbi:unnamed protein product, partial [Allacma fusca]